MTTMTIEEVSKAMGYRLTDVDPAGYTSLFEVEEWKKAIDVYLATPRQVSDEDVNRVWNAMGQSNPTKAYLRAALESIPHHAAKVQDVDQLLHDVGYLVEAAQRAIPFLMDESSKYDDDGSNEPLETARDIESAIALLDAAPEYKGRG